jgi:hypothetical protein
VGGTVLFIHGMGVREVAYNHSFNKIKDKLKEMLPAINVQKCYWGNLGGQLHFNGASIPRLKPVTSSYYGVTDSDQITHWEILYQDPLYELKLIALGNSEVQKHQGIGKPPRSEAVLETLRRASYSEENLSKLLKEGDIDQVFEEARNEILKDPILKSALDSGVEINEINKVISRAIIAQSITTFSAKNNFLPTMATNIQIRDETVNALASIMGWTPALGVNDIWSKFKNAIFQPVLQDTLTFATWFIERKKEGYKHTTSNAVGDVLLYQSRGDPIRKYIKTQIMNAAQPVVLLAHSLGGIASVDLLIKENPGVKLLVTVGSQSPYFYEIGALSSLSTETTKKPSERLPDHFPKWRNFYDLRDFLSNVAHEVFGENRVLDYEVDNNQPFPVSHCSYWDNDLFWEEFVRQVKKEVFQNV